MGMILMPCCQMKTSPINAVIARVAMPVYSTDVAMDGLSGKAPLPPLKGVLLVCRSRPLLKSRYSFSVLTLTCASVAPTNTSANVW